MFKSPVSSILLNELNLTKCEISKFPFWMYHVKSNFLYENVNIFDKKKRVSRAFYKMMEISRKCNIIPNNSVLCLCEAPGGFIEALLYLNPELKIKAQSVGDIKFSPKINSEIYEYSDITKIETLLKFAKYSKDNGKFDLITADGGIDVSDDYSKQESKCLRVIFSQIITMLYNLKVGGDFIIKVFDCFQKETVQLLYVLYCNFEHFEIFKPVLSRPCNSEKYIICKNFKGYNKIPGFLNQMKENKIEFDIEISKEFYDKMTNINNLMVEDQIDNIRNILNMCKYSRKFNSNNYKEQMRSSHSLFNFLDIR